MLFILCLKGVVVALIPVFRAVIFLLLGFGRRRQDFPASYGGDRLANGGDVGFVFRVADEFIDEVDGNFLAANNVVKIDDVLHDDTFLSFCRKLWRVAGSDWTNSSKISRS